jgi:hypothetical protein
MMTVTGTSVLILKSSRILMLWPVYTILNAPDFFSLTACPNTLGIDAFRFYWGKPNICWIFPPVPLISKSINHLRLCSGTGLLIVPQWKNYSFYPMLTEIDNKFVKGVKVYNGAALLKKGDDDSSCFGPHFRGNIEIWYLKF